MEIICFNENVLKLDLFRYIDIVLDIVIDMSRQGKRL